MSDVEAAPEIELEQLMELAAAGDKVAGRKFLQAFLSAQIFIPERYQPRPLAGEPKYPNDFVWAMGIQDGDRVIVPAFSREELISEWAGTELTFKLVSGKEILNAVPEDWWLWLNPGLEVEKEFSPWEVAELKNGEAGLDTVLAEIFPEEIVEPLSIAPTAEGDYKELKAALQKFAESNRNISKLFLLVEEGENMEGEILSQLLVGVEANLADSEEVEKLREDISIAAGPSMIGSNPLKILVGRDANDGLYLSLFKDATPIFERPRGGIKNSIKDLLARVLDK